MPGVHARGADESRSRSLLYVLYMLAVESATIMNAVVELVNR